MSLQHIRSLRDRTKYPRLNIFLDTVRDGCLILSILLVFLCVHGTFQYIHKFFVNHGLIQEDISYLPISFIRVMFTIVEAVSILSFAIICLITIFKIWKIVYSESSVLT